MIGSVWRFKMDRFLSNNNYAWAFHHHSEPSGRECLCPQDPSWLLHAGKFLGPAFDDSGLIAPWTIGVEIAGQIAQYPWVSPQPCHQVAQPAGPLSYLCPYRRQGFGLL